MVSARVENSPFHQFDTANRNSGGFLAYSEQNPDLVVRWNTYSPPDWLPNKSPAELLADQTAAINNMRAAGIAIPKTRPIITPHPIEQGKAVTCLLIDRVYGLNLHFDDVPEDIRDDAMSSMLTLLENVTTKGGSYIADLGIKQFMHGTTANDRNPKSYFIDLQSYVKEFDPKDQTWLDGTGLVYDLAKVLSDIETMEERRDAPELEHRQRLSRIAGHITKFDHVFAPFMRYLQSENAGLAQGGAAYVKGSPLYTGAI